MVWALALILMAAASSNQVTLDVTYREPWEDTQSQPMTDLAYTTIWVAAGMAAYVPKDIPASSPNGGGWITDRLIVPRQGNKAFTVQVWVTATDTSGNPSENSEIVTLVVPKAK